MKNFLKSLTGSPRIGASAGKTLLFFWLKKDLQYMKGDLGVDLAGGSMFNHKFFKTNEYICVDIDQSKLDKGKNKNPSAIAINSKLQDFMKNDNQKKADVLLCVQTMGTNQFFEHDETLKVVSLMYDFLKPGGSMIFNVGLKKELNQIEKEINILLKKKFKSMKIRSYGALHKTKQKSLQGSSFNLVNFYHIFNRIILAYLMHILPPLRTFFGFKKNKIYVVCKKKI